MTVWACWDSHLIPEVPLGATDAADSNHDKQCSSSSNASVLDTDCTMRQCTGSIIAWHFNLEVAVHNAISHISLYKIDGLIDQACKANRAHRMARA